MRINMIIKKLIKKQKNKNNLKLKYKKLQNLKLIRNGNKLIWNNHV